MNTTLVLSPFSPALSNQHDVLLSLTPAVADRLHLLTDLKSKRWWSSEFFQFMEQPDCGREFAQMRKEARLLDDSLLVVLVGDMVTEEALPNYAARLSVMFPDRSGVDDNPWAVWQRGWTAEEEQHGSALHTYLTLSGRVNLRAVSESTYSLLKNGFRQDPSLYKGIFYPMFQEPATHLSHANVARLAHQQGVRMAAEICGKIASDEKRHARFYLELARLVFECDPAQAVREYAEMLEQGVVMPAALMEHNGRSAPDLFQDFAAVASRIGVYTAFDYADLIENLNRELRIPDLRISDEAARAQEKLLQLPSRIRRVAERRKASVSTRSSFAWIHDRAA